MNIDHEVRDFLQNNQSARDLLSARNMDGLIKSYKGDKKDLIYALIMIGLIDWNAFEINDYIDGESIAILSNDPTMTDKLPDTIRLKHTNYLSDIKGVSHFIITKPSSYNSGRVIGHPDSDFKKITIVDDGDESRVAFTNCRDLQEIVFEGGCPKNLDSGFLVKCPNVRDITLPITKDELIKNKVLDPHFCMPRSYKKNITIHCTDGDITFNDESKKEDQK